MANSCPKEFVDARRRAIQNAPQVLYRNEPPLELQNVKGLADGTHGEVGYVTFGKSLPLSAIAKPNHKLSPLPPPPHIPKTTRNHLPHPDLPRLLPLPH